uniref:Sulfur stress regulator n=1 Tax=Tetraselmis sp. GSL018 TaxID=582737 RepID=A0A061R595_9CHLO|mmetsp:Transcript_27498/g.65149  ORF Transcript_27498/g.65149 Transcript_27498/m.65149 type:complete len:350 (+) Transcript_27498:218-1267(+)|eukprot:CAMPEP_0177597818 /NCGR_PEP_ID=MMETSP0419_2-20121207/11940_1 /TAXON_ID=582737 /ORGANISM="Tetraselmis sp., Strain GSL018" /LENGTH=349 /DNA_ID=CAMNT_0019090065 /DNA_START=175 /DNA_END=1224 /DNA_ORIENTATION=+
MASPEDDPLENHPKYEKIRNLNRGSFGFVQLARRRDTRKELAIKFIERGDKISKNVEREIHNHRSLYHPHIIKFEEVFLTSKYIGIAMEFAAGGDLFDFVVSRGGLKEDEARWFFQQLICAVDYMHHKGVVNRDIKLENSLLTNHVKPLLKICDFGYSKSDQNDSVPKSKVGTYLYVAPEVIADRNYDGKRADIWSCGVMLYAMLAGQYPFERPEDKGAGVNDHQKLQNVMKRILEVDYQIPRHLRVSTECQDLLSRILVREPERRITLVGIQRHPFYTRDLPTNFFQVNEQLKAAPLPEDMQSHDSIDEIIREAKNSPTPFDADAEDLYVDDSEAGYFDGDDLDSEDI